MIIYWAFTVATAKSSWEPWVWLVKGKIEYLCSFGNVFVVKPLILCLIVIDKMFMQAISCKIIFLVKSFHPLYYSFGLIVTIEYGWNNPDVFWNRFLCMQLGKPVHVEVQDYKLLCLAQITSLNRKMLMIGILGEWWILYSSTSRFNFDPFSVTSPFAWNFK